MIQMLDHELKTDPSILFSDSSLSPTEENMETYKKNMETYKKMKSQCSTTQDWRTLRHLFVPCLKYVFNNIWSSVYVC